MAKFGYSGEKAKARESMAGLSKSRTDDILLLDLRDYARRTIQDHETGDVSGQMAGYFFGCLDAVRGRLTADFNAHAVLQPVAKVMQAVPAMHLEDPDYLAKAVMNVLEPRENPWLNLGGPAPANK